MIIPEGQHEDEQQNIPTQENAPTVYLRNKADIGCYTRADSPGLMLYVK